MEPVNIIEQLTYSNLGATAELRDRIQGTELLVATYKNTNDQMLAQMHLINQSKYEQRLARLERENASLWSLVMDYREQTITLSARVKALEPALLPVATLLSDEILSDDGDVTVMGDSPPDTQPLTQSN
jgi:hypothetical protein